MTTQRNDVIVVEASGLVRVCAWCLPAKRLAEIHREYRCTDGLCFTCKATLDEECASTNEPESGRSPLRLVLAGSAPRR